LFLNFISMKKVVAESHIKIFLDILLIVLISITFKLSLIFKLERSEYLLENFVLNVPKF